MYEVLLPYPAVDLEPSDEARHAYLDAMLPLIWERLPKVDNYLGQAEENDLN
jgi:hypothetical protein